jgi:hypothetical protein
LLSPRRLLRVFRSRPSYQVALAIVVATNQLGIIALAAGPPGGVATGRQLACIDPSDAGPLGACSKQPTDSLNLRAGLPADGRQCPASGPGASCSGSESTPPGGPGVASIPDGLNACPVTAAKPGPDAPASCNDTLLPPTTPAESSGRPGVSFAAQPVSPGVPALSLQYSGPQLRVELVAKVTALEPGTSTTLVATSNASVTGTRNAIEIFDQTTGGLAGVCLQSSQCQVAYASPSGTHTFAAFVTPPTATIDASAAPAQSRPVSVTWLGVTLTAGSPTVIAPGKAVIFMAQATADVAKLGYVLELYDSKSGARVTYCSQGTTCRTALTQAAAGVRSIVALVAALSDSLPTVGVQATSASVSATWLSVSLAANTTFPQAGGTVYLRATANADLTNTPWSIGIYDQNGRLVDQACKSGASCAVRVKLTSEASPWYNAVVGEAVSADKLSVVGQMLGKLVDTTSLVNVQARSAAVQPTRLLWGVDSCRAVTDGLHPQVVTTIGKPDFWGRYLTTTPNCPGLSSEEIALAKGAHMGILPIYNDYDCSAVSGYDTGYSYATDASGAARRLGIPRDRIIAIDIEPPGPWCSGAVDAEFIKGWFDGVKLFGYAPTYYGNGTDGTEFAQAWCGAIGDRPEIAGGSYLWSFEPSLLGSFSKAAAPEFGPYQPGCGGNFAAWQYQISSGGTPDVDHDEALSILPLWFP